MSLQIASLNRDELAVIELGSFVEYDLWAENDQASPEWRETSICCRFPGWLGGDDDEADTGA